MPPKCKVCGAISTARICPHCAEVLGIVRDARAKRDPAQAVLARHKQEDFDFRHMTKAAGSSIRRA